MKKKITILMSIYIIHSYIRKIINEITQKPNINIPIETILYVLRQLRTILMKESMLISTTCPINVVGDIHGQYSDLLNIFTRLGTPSNKNRYMFLGDYVDRGTQSIETFVLISCYKILYPDDVVMLRGNHESADISREYGFLDECRRRYNVKLWKHFCDVFNTMSVAATISSIMDDTPLAFCAHGGISRELKNLDQINKIRKPIEVDDEGIMCDLLWSDPNPDGNGWKESDRGVSYIFGINQLHSFMNHFNFELVIRGHQVCEDGYEFFGNRSLVTVFSASNYCGEFDNKAAVMKISERFCCTFEIFD